MEYFGKHLTMNWMQEWLQLSNSLILDAENNSKMHIFVENEVILKIVNDVLTFKTTIWKYWTTITNFLYFIDNCIWWSHSGCIKKNTNTDGWNPLYGTKDTEIKSQGLKDMTFAATIFV